MKSIKDLYQFLEDQFGSDRFGLHSYGYTQGWAIAKNIEDEIADSYMRLPADADGEPIHVGDKVVWADKGSFEVCGVNEDSVWFDGSVKEWVAAWANDCHHVKPRTLEDVLRSYACDFADSSGPDYDEEITRKYAAEIRELLGFEINEPDTIRNELEDNGHIATPCHIGELIIGR